MEQYKPEITTQPKNNNSDYLIDLKFKNINKFFVLSFKNGDDDPKINSFDEYYMSLVETKNVNELVDNKIFFDQPVKRIQEAYEINVQKSKNNDYTTEDLLNDLYHQNYYKLIGKYLSRQTNTSICEQINFVGKLEEDDGATKYFIAENQEKTFLHFSLDSYNCNRIIK